eukprot:scaffold246095_cov33-Tisochrysis_lutea.AAC.2
MKSSGCGVSSFRKVPMSPAAIGAKWPGNATRYLGLDAPERPFLCTGMPAPSDAIFLNPLDA